MSENIKHLSNGTVFLCPEDVEQKENRMLKELSAFFADKKVNILCSNTVAGVIKEEASLHKDSKTFAIEEFNIVGEFGLLVEDSYGSYYVGPFRDNEEAMESARSLINEQWIYIGTQIFIVKDTFMLRKTFKD